MPRRRKPNESTGAKMVYEHADGSATVVIPEHLRTFEQGQSFLMPYINIPNKIRPQRKNCCQAWVLDRVRELAKQHGRVMSRAFIERELVDLDSEYTGDQILSALAENVSRHNRIPYATAADVLQQIEL